MALARRRKRWWPGALLVAALAVGGSIGTSGGSIDGASVCFGSSANGALRNAWKLPLTGPNFREYNTAGWLLGRTFVHSAVLEVVLEAYAELAVSHPEVTFIYGETGFPRGGPIAAASHASERPGGGLRGPGER